MAEEDSVIVATKKATTGGVPQIPHITSNYVPLSQVIASLSIHSHAELQNVLETLPSVKSDLARKRRLLDFLVKSRREFVKLYVLCKWANVSNEISQCIDVVSWLTGQQNCFTNVVNVLYTVERGLGGAKMREPDIETALEVLKFGRPVQKSREFIPLKPLSPKVVLGTLHDLNVLLSIRLALTEELPDEFRNYEIADGRVKFTIDESFVVDLGVADDTVDAQFFFIDFRFCFDDSKKQSPPVTVISRLEKIVNGILADKSKPLAEAFHWLLRFTQNYKLSIINDQLGALNRGLWSGVLSHQFYPDKSLLLVQYWINRPGPRNIVRIGLSKTTHKIAIRWRREGRDVDLQAKHSSSIIESFGTYDLNVERLLTEIIQLHIRYIIENIAIADAANIGPNVVESASSNTIATTSSINFNHNFDANDSATTVPTTAANNIIRSSSTAGPISPPSNKLKFRLCGSRHVTFSIEPLSGRCVLQNPTQLILSAEKSLNELSDLVTQAPDVLFKLRYISLQEEITQRAKAAGWVANSNVSISNEDMKKHFYLVDPSTVTVFSLRRPEWAPSWFLLVSLGRNRPPTWFMSRLQSKDKLWNVLFLETLNIELEDASTLPDYRLFDELGSFITSRFMINGICRELDIIKARYSLLLGTDDLGNKRPAVLVNLNTLTKNSWAYSSLLIVLNSSNDVAILQGRTKKSIEHSVESINDNIDGNSNASNSDTKSKGSNGVVIDSVSGRFMLRVPLPVNRDAADDGSDSTFITSVVSQLSRIERMVSYVELIKSMSLHLLEASMNRITFEYGESLQATIILGEEAAATATANATVTSNIAAAAPNAGTSITNATTTISTNAAASSATTGPSITASTLTTPTASAATNPADSAMLSNATNATPTELTTLILSPSSPHFRVSAPLQSILSHRGLLPVVWILRTTLPIYEAIETLERTSPVPVVVVARSVVEIRIVYPKHNVSLELKLIKRHKRDLVHIREVELSFANGQQQGNSTVVVNGGGGRKNKKGTAQINAEDPSTRTSPLETAGIWKERFSNPSIIPLTDGAVSPVDCVSVVLDKVTETLSQI